MWKCLWNISLMWLILCQRYISWKCSKYIPFNFLIYLVWRKYECSDLFDGVDLTSETYFIQIFPPWKPENSFMAKGSSKYQRHWSVTMWVFTPFFHSNNWKCCPKSLIIEWRVDEIAISLFMCPSILYLLGGIILSFRRDNFIF